MLFSHRVSSASTSSVCGRSIVSPFIAQHNIRLMSASKTWCGTLLKFYSMSISRLIACLLSIFAMLLPLSAQNKHKPMTGSAAKGAMNVAPDLDQRLGRWQTVRMPFHAQGLSPKEVKMVAKLVD